MSTAIDCQKLSKRYPGSSLFALKDLDLQVKAGEIYGFLGPNGAGKSTTIRTLLNFIQPTSGVATIAGLDIVKDSVAVKKHVGYLAGEIALYRRMTGRQFFGYMQSLQPLKSKDYFSQLVKRFQAELNQPISDLSKGNRQKIGVIQACMHEPDILILDEPTAGLDPLMQEVFYDVAEEAKNRGAAVFLSSHDLAEVRKMCDRIGFIREGELVAEKSISELASAAAHSFDITFKGKLPLQQLRQLPGSQVKELTAHSVNIVFRGELAPLFGILGKNEVIGLDKPEVDLEQEFLRLYQKESDQEETDEVDA